MYVRLLYFLHHWINLPHLIIRSEILKAAGSFLFAPSNFIACELFKATRKRQTSLDFNAIVWKKIAKKDVKLKDRKHICDINQEAESWNCNIFYLLL